MLHTCYILMYVCMYTYKYTIPSFTCTHGIAGPAATLYAKAG
jgi:hypothetical protein